jgi:cysteine-rich repeat protein
MNRPWYKIHVKWVTLGALLGVGAVLCACNTTQPVSAEPRHDAASFADAAGAADAARIPLRDSGDSSIHDASGDAGRRDGGNEARAPLECVYAICGDGFLDPGEECDDLNNDNGDGCSGQCKLEPSIEYCSLPFAAYACGGCGDGLLEPGEECDDGNTVDGDGCNADCTITGDAGVDGGNTSDAGVRRCGDGKLKQDEGCDDGNNISGDGCSESCQLEFCGDGIVQNWLLQKEECDDGNLEDGDGCRRDCTLEICGDGIVDRDEACDDGNTEDGDCCSSTCRIPF